MYPKVSSTVLSFFVCREINNVDYLVADFSEQCEDSRCAIPACLKLVAQLLLLSLRSWLNFIPIALLFIGIYPVRCFAPFLSQCVACS